MTRGLAWLALCVAAAAAVLYATSTGVGVTPDSTAYFGTARHWLTRLGGVPLLDAGTAYTYFPPFYPAELAVASLLLREDPAHAARWLAVIALPVNLLLVGMLVRRGVPAAPLAPFVAALVFLTDPVMLTIHTTALSEAGFLALLMLGVRSLDDYQARPGRWQLLAVTAVAAAACLQRSAGIALVLTAMTVVGLREGGPTLRRLAVAGAVGAASLLPYVAWQLYSPGFQGASFHPVDGAWWQGGGRVVARWVVPESVPVEPEVRGVLAVAVLAAGTVAAIRHRARLASADSSVAAILGGLLCACLVVLVGAATFWDAAVGLGRRLMAPVWLALMLLVVIAISRAWHAQPGARLGRAAATALATAWMLVTLDGAATWLAATHAQGQGYNGRDWQQSPVMLAVRALPAGTFLVSNGNDAVLAVTGRRAARLPDIVNPGTRRPNPQYAARLTELRQRLLERRGVVVLLDRMRSRAYIPGEAELLAAWRMTVLTRTADGVLFRLVGDDAPAGSAAEPVELSQQPQR